MQNALFCAGLEDQREQSGNIIESLSLYTSLLGILCNFRSDAGENLHLSLINSKIKIELHDHR